MEKEKIVKNLLKEGEIQALQAGVSSAIQDACRNLGDGIWARRGKYVCFQEDIACAKSKIEEAEAIFEALQARREGDE